MQPKRVLIISEYIAPVQHIAAIRWTKYAKYLAKDFGCDVTVLTNKKCFENETLEMKHYKYDSLLSKDLKYFKACYIPLTVRQRVVNCFFSLGQRMLQGMQRRQKNAIRDPSEGGHNNKTTNNSLFGLCFSWMLNKNIPETLFEIVEGACGNAIVSAGVRASLDFENFDYVISSYGPRWPHDLALRIKQRCPSVYWIADFRDALVYSERTDTQSNRELTRRYSSNADFISSISEGCAENLCIEEGKSWGVFFNGFDPDDIASARRERSDRFELTYTGTLYSEGEAKRDLSPLYRVVDELIAEGTIDGDRIVCTYAGPSSHLFSEYVRRFPLIHFEDKGLLSREEALTLQGRASVLVASNWNTQLMRGGLSGKVFEYLAKDVPLIGLVSGDVPHSALRELIESCEAGVCFEEAEPNTYAGLKNYIARQYSDWMVNGLTSRGEHSLELSLRFAYPQLAKVFIQTVDAAVRKRSTPPNEVESLH